jgi:hypothetical protein
MKSLEIEVRWTAIESAQGKTWTFLTPISPYMRKHFAKPAVYRWCVRQSGKDVPQCIYIGEAVSLVDRIRRVTKPPRQSKPSNTNARLNKIFTDHQSQGLVVTVEQAAFEEFALNGLVFSPSDMTLFHKFKRCALENLILCSCLELGDGLLNLRLEPHNRIEKQLLAAGVDPSVVRKMDVKQVIGAF